MPTFNVKLLGKREVAKGTMLFELEKPENFEFKAGQHIHVKILNHPPTEEKMSRHFSIATSPTNEILEIAMRMRESAFKTTLNLLEKDALVEVRGPSGDFVLPLETARLIFLAGGIGITPFRSMIQYCFDTYQEHDISLFYSNRSMADAPFFEEFRNLRKNNYHFVPTFTQQQAWTGEKGYITKEMIQKYVRNPLQAMFYVAGPPAFVKSIVKILTEMGIKNIKEDEFSGYNG